jgi:hypothetical protein
MPNMITRHLFWSGGWDSTFRLLYVLLVRNEVVQPYYIVRAVRKSTHQEQAAQDAVRVGLAAKFPEAATRLLPTKTLKNDAIPFNVGLNAQFEGLQRAILLKAPQYKEIAFFAAHVAAGQPHPPFELGFTKDGTVFPRFYQELEMVEIDGEVQARLQIQLTHPDLELLRAFSFPIFAYTKLELGEIARAQGFADLLHKSWFCHRPVFGKIPCGTCNPCWDARKLGLGYRLHWVSHARYFVSEYMLDPWRRWLKGKPSISSPTTNMAR